MSFAEWVTTLVDVLKALGWQLTLLVIVLLFRKDITGVLRILTTKLASAVSVRIGASGIEIITFAPEQEDIGPPPTPQDRE
jgi:hypothetical protein